jgi:hypothetical protein
MAQEFAHKPRQLVAAFAQTLAARENCRKAGNSAWFTVHSSRLADLCREHMPSGSGVGLRAGGTEFDFDASKPDRLVFNTGFHHMDESGGYDGWTEHQVIVTPSLVFGFELRITGRDRNDIKDYLAELYQSALSAEIAD